MSFYSTLFIHNYAVKYAGAAYIALSVATNDANNTITEDCFKFDTISFINNSATEANEIF